MVNLPWYKDMNTRKAHKAEDMAMSMERFGFPTDVDLVLELESVNLEFRVCSNGTIATRRNDCEDCGGHPKGTHCPVP